MIKIGRVIFDCVLFLSIFILPWWLNIFLALVGIFLFKDFYEFIIVGIIYFSLYANSSGRIISSPIFFITAVTLSFLVIQILKDNLSIYKK